MSDKYPTGSYYDRQATAQVTVPPSQSLQLPTDPPSDGAVFRQSMTLVTQIVVIITCLAVLVTLAEAWHTYFAVRDAMADLGNSFRNSGLGGN